MTNDQQKVGNSLSRADEKIAHYETALRRIASYSPGLTPIPGDPIEIARTALKIMGAEINDRDLAICQQIKAGIDAAREKGVWCSYPTAVRINDQVRPWPFEESRRCSTNDAGSKP